MSKEFKCSAPWEGMFINPDGDFRVCCAGKSLGNLNQNTADEIIYGDTLNKVRNDILTCGSSEYCANCIESEEKSGRSMREQFNTTLEGVDTTKFTPKYIDIRWKNTCQLRCGYCNSEWSSTYAKWEGKTERVSAIDWQRDVLDFLARDPGSIQVVNLLGGEPLLLKDNVEMMNYVDPSAIVGIVTNLASENVHNLPVYKTLVSRRANWLVSLEATGNKFEYIRRNAKWSVVKDNYEKLTPNGSKGCHMTYCITSAFSLVDVFDWLYEVNPNPDENTTFISVLLGPQQFSIYSFPPEIKLLAIDELDRLMQKHESFLNQATKDFIVATKQSLNDQLNDWDIEHVTRYMEYVRQSDIEMAPISFEQEWPEVYSILKRYTA